MGRSAGTPSRCIRDGNLSLDIEKIPLKDISQAWGLKFPGKRIVIVL
jgi:hypothetical protein